LTLTLTLTLTFRSINFNGTGYFVMPSSVVQVNLRNVGRQKYAHLDIQSDQLQVSVVFIIGLRCTGLLEV